MIGFSDFLWQLHLITITYNSSKWVTVSGSFRFLQDYERLPFLCGRHLRPTNSLIRSLTHWTVLNDVCLTNALKNLLLISHCFETESESYITTDGQSAILSWSKAPIWGLRPDFYYCLTIAGFWYGAPSLTRGRVCLLQCIIYNIFTVSDLRPGPCIYIPQEQGGPVITPGTGYRVLTPAALNARMNSLL
jgi:hypothetical protein